MEQESLTLIELLDKHATVIGTLLGVLIGSISTLVLTWITQKSEDRKHLQSLSFNAGLEEFKLAQEYAKLMMQRGIKKSVPPSAIYIISSMMTADLLRKRKITSKEQLIHEYKKQKEISDGLMDWILNEHKKKKEKNSHPIID